jgi:hypothetical protein
LALLDNGSQFDTDELRDEHIVSYYERVYNPDPKKINYENCIENFLGPEIVNSDLVQGSRLTENERALLNADLTVDELDESLNNANMKSAPGQDGFSNKLIRKCWKYLRLPL